MTPDGSSRLESSMSSCAAAIAAPPLLASRRVYAARVERELIMTGIGGQGVQIAVRALARAAASSGRNVMLFGMFGGSVRGGKTEATLVVSDEEIEAPPILAQTWSAVALHPKFFETVAP